MSINQANYSYINIPSGEMRGRDLLATRTVHVPWFYVWHYLDTNRRAFMLWVDNFCHSDGKQTSQLTVLICSLRNKWRLPVTRSAWKVLYRVCKVECLDRVQVKQKQRNDVLYISLKVDRTFLFLFVVNLLNTACIFLLACRVQQLSSNLCRIYIIYLVEVHSFCIRHQRDRLMRRYRRVSKYATRIVC